MKTHLKIFAAAAMTVGAMSVGYGQNSSNTATGSENQLNNAADRAADKTDRAADKTGAALDNAADRSSDAARNAADKTSSTLDKAASGQGVHGTAQAPDAEGIRDVLASTTEATVKGSLSDIVERFVDADRNRLGKAMPSDSERQSLDDLKKQFRDAWKAKYNQEFDIEKEELVFNPSVRIMQGEFTATTPDNAARTAGERSSAADERPAHRDTTEGETALGRAADRTGDAVVNTADKAEDAVAAGAKRTRDAVTGNADANREKGRNMAHVMIPASHGMPAINVPMIHELPDSWRIDIPDNLDAAKLQANLQKHLQMALDDQAKWPADANEAYLSVAHHILLGVFEGTPNVMQGSGTDAAQPAAGTLSPSATPATPAQPQ
jgi:hypothetical protein